MAWVYATERGASGQWHVHALTTGTRNGIADYLAMDWALRNGHVHVQAVTDGIKAVLYTTKDAAARGEVVCADTLTKYRDMLNDLERVSLLPPER